MKTSKPTRIKAAKRSTTRQTDTAAEATTEASTKQDRLIAMLRSRDGATIDAMMEAAGWQQHSVRGFLAGVVRRKLKLKLMSNEVDGKRVYRIGGLPKANAVSPDTKRLAA